MMSHRPEATPLRALTDGARDGPTPDPEADRIPVDLLARQARCGRAGVGHIGVSGWIYDAEQEPLGHVDGAGIIRCGTRRIAAVDRGRVVALDGPDEGAVLGTIRTVVRPEYEMAYLCQREGAVQAFVLLNRERSGQLEHSRLIQLAGAALALLGARLER